MLLGLNVSLYLFQALKCISDYTNEENKKRRKREKKPLINRYKIYITSVVCRVLCVCVYVVCVCVCACVCMCVCFDTKLPNCLLDLVTSFLHKNDDNPVGK